MINANLLQNNMHNMLLVTQKYFIVFVLISTPTVRLFNTGFLYFSITSVIKRADGPSAAGVVEVPKDCARVPSLQTDVERF